MSRVYFTITGLKHYYGSDFFRPGMKVKLKKEPDNPYDHEAIMVKLKGLGKVGYVANSTYTVLGDSMSAGRLYDKIGKKAKGRVEYILPNGIICSLKLDDGEGDDDGSAEDEDGSKKSKRRADDDEDEEESDS